MDVVRELAAKLSLQVDKASFSAGDKAIEGTKSRLGDIPIATGAIAAAAAVAAKQLKDIFIGFNSDIEQSVISMAAIQKMFKGGDWGGQMETAGKLVEHYQEVAKASVGETRDFIEMHKGIAASAYQAGASLDDLKEITKGAVIASSAMGESAIVSAMDVKQALSKGVSVRDRFMMNLLASEKITQAKFNAMTKQQRVDTLKQLLTSDWIKSASKQMEGSFEGVVSTMKDTLKITLGKVGLPIFKELTAEVKKWNQYLSNPNNAFFSLITRNASELAAGFKIVAGTVSAVVGLLEMVNKQINVLKSSRVGHIFDAFANPIKEAADTIRDIVDFLSGEASAIGLARATQQGWGKQYMEHAAKGGKFTTFSLRDMTAGGDIVAKDREKDYRNRPDALDAATKGLSLRTALGDTAAAFKRGDTGAGVMAGIGAAATFPVTVQQAVIRAGQWAYESATGPSKPGGKWSTPLPSASMMPNAPPPMLASMPPEAQQVKMSGDVKVQVEVKVPDAAQVTSESNQSVWRATGALYSSEASY